MPTHRPKPKAKSPTVSNGGVGPVKPAASVIPPRGNSPSPRVNPPKPRQIPSLKPTSNKIDPPIAGRVDPNCPASESFIKEQETIWYSFPVADRNRLKEWFPKYAPSLNTHLSFYLWLYSFQRIRNLDTGKYTWMIAVYVNHPDKAGLTFSQICGVMGLPHTELQPPVWTFPVPAEELAKCHRYKLCHPEPYGLLGKVTRIPYAQITEWPRTFDYDDPTTYPESSHNDSVYIPPKELPPPPVARPTGKSLLMNIKGTKSLLTSVKGTKSLLTSVKGTKSLLTGVKPVPSKK